MKSLLLLLTLLLISNRVEAQPAVGGCIGPTVYQSGVFKGCGDILNIDPELSAVTGGGTSLNLLQANSVTEFGVDCTGATDATASMAAAAAASVGKALILPPGCVPRFASPGAGNAAVTFLSGTHVLCADSTAGFAVLRQRCEGGTYPGAACNASSECLGGGACKTDFGTTVSAACSSGTNCFAPLAGSVYTLVKTGGPGAWIENCSFFTAQADPYQRCVGGSNNGLACRQECDNGTTGVLTPPGTRCQANSDCPTSLTCLRIADCATPGGTCTGAPIGSSGAGDILPLDTTGSSNSRINYVSIYDHFRITNGTIPASIAIAPGTVVTGANTAAVVNNCTSPLTTPTASACTSSQAGGCCYGALNAFGGAGSNTLPAIAVANGILANAGGGSESTITDSAFRGTIGIAGGVRNRIDRCKQAITGSNASGATAGIQVGNFSTVSNNQLMNLVGGGIGVNATGTDTTVEKNTLLGAYAIGIMLDGKNGAALRNTMKTTTASASCTAAGTPFPCCTGVGAGICGTGVIVSGDSSNVSNNYIESNAAGAGATGIMVGDLNPTNCTGPGAPMPCCTGAGAGAGCTQGLASLISKNVVLSVPAQTLQNGIRVQPFGGGSSLVQNQIRDVVTAAFQIQNNPQPVWITNNITDLKQLLITPTYHPVHVLDNFGGTQVMVSGNYFAGGWRGIDAGTSTQGLMNIMVANNRFYGLGGALVNMGGAGVQVFNNYGNVGTSGGGLPTFVCDASCAGGAVATRGLPCHQDTDCTTGGNTCNASVQKCIPEPITGFIGSASGIQGSAYTWHSGWGNNIMFAFGAGGSASRQCSGMTTYPGAGCMVLAANGSCSGGTCTASAGPAPPATCVGGADAGKTCCLGASPTCSVRTRKPFVRIVDYGSTHSVGDLMFQGNKMFNADQDYVYLDAVSSASLGNISIDMANISGNDFSGSPAGPNTNITGINLPSTGTFTNLDISGNSFNRLSQDVAGWKGTYGRLVFNPAMISLASDVNVTSNNFVDITGLALPFQANRNYFYSCEITFTSSTVTTGVGFAMSIGAAAASATTFATITRIPTATILTGAGTDVVQEQMGTGNDSTPVVSAGVGAALTKYMANMRGNILATTAGTLQARMKSETNTVQVTAVASSNCMLQQMP